MKYEITIMTASYDKSAICEHKYSVCVTADSYSDAVFYATKNFQNILSIHIFAKG